jgi:hypothetical protein
LIVGETSPMTAFNPSFVSPILRLASVRAGWIRWCSLQSEESCKGADELHGFRLAAAANDRGGNRPTACEVEELTVADLV